MQDISEEILAKASAGDLESFAALYKTTAGLVYNVALRIVNNREDAQEVTQEVFLIIYHKLKSFRFESSFKTWVYRITANYAINFAKRESKNKTVEYDDNLMTETNDNDIQSEIDQEHKKKMIEELLSAINPEQRACVILRNLEGLSYQQIAETLQIKVNTVRSRLKRAREKLLLAGKKAVHGYL